jgi:Holliday junction resolvase
MNRNKAQGTAFETWTRRALNALGIQAQRLPEGGSLDEGDVEALLDTRWVIECKAQSNLNIQKVLGRARRKAGGDPVILVWKRLVRVEGKKVRQPVEGERIVVSLGWSDFVRLITQADPAGDTAVPDTEEES